MNYKGEEEGRRKITIVIFVSGILNLGIIILCLYSLSFGMEGFLSTISVVTIIALFSAIVGAFGGFIFGIPRTPSPQG